MAERTTPQRRSKDRITPLADNSNPSTPATPSTVSPSPTRVRIAAEKSPEQPRRSPDSQQRRRARTLPDASPQQQQQSRGRKHTIAARPEGLNAVLAETQTATTTSSSKGSSTHRPQSPQEEETNDYHQQLEEPAKSQRSSVTARSTAAAISERPPERPRRAAVKLSAKPRKPTSTPAPEDLTTTATTATTSTASSPATSGPTSDPTLNPPNSTSFRASPRASPRASVHQVPQVQQVHQVQQVPRVQVSRVGGSDEPPSSRRMIEHPHALEDCVRMMRLACDQGNGSMALEAQQRLTEVNAALPSRRSTRSSTVAYRSQIFSAVGVAALPARGARPTATASFLSHLHETGLLCQTCNALWRGELARESIPGRLLLSLLRTAAGIPDCHAVLREVFKYNPSGLLKCCRETIVDPFAPEDTRRHAAELVLTLADDTELRRLVRNEDPILVALVEATVRPKGAASDFSPVLPQSDESPLLFVDGVSQQAPLSPLERQRQLELMRQTPPPAAPKAVLDEFDEGMLAFIKDQQAISDTLCVTTAVDRLIEMLDLARVGHRLERFSQAGGDAVMLQLMRRARLTNDKIQLARCMQAVSRACAADGLYRNRILREILSNFSPADLADKTTTDGLRAYIALLSTSVIKRKLHGGWGVSEDDDGKCIALLNRQLAEIEEAAGGGATAGAPPDAYVAKTAAFLRGVISDPQNGLTLERAHKQLQLTATEDLDIGENTIVERLFTYVVETLGLYARTPESADARQFAEQRHGNLALQLLGAGSRRNEAAMLRADVHQVLLDGMRSHSDLHACQDFILCAEQLCLTQASLAAAMADHPDGAGVTSQSVVRVRTALSGRPMPELEEVLAPRLHLVRLLARNRQVFAQTAIAEYLLQLLDDCDNYYFGEIRFLNDDRLQRALSKNRRSTGSVRPLTRRVNKEETTSKKALLRDHPSEASLPPWTLAEHAVVLALHVPLMETLRTIFCRNFEEALLTRAMPQRLLGLVIQADTNPAVLHHVLFIIGALCANPRIREEFVELQGGERVLDLLRRAYPMDSARWVTEVVCNGAMALASVVVGDDEACRQFNAYGGIATAVAMLRARSRFNDAHGVNGASSLICNLTFRNEAARALLGEVGACDAFVEALRLYRRGGGEAAARSLSMAALFRAIGNLALLPANVAKFMASGIPAAFAAFLEEADGRLDDATLESCFRTLAILVLEVGDVTQFHCAVIPVLTLLRKCLNTDTQVYRWAFECIGQLCRFRRSAEVFVREAGPETVLSILPFLAYDRDLLSAALFAIGIQTCEPRTIPKLVELGAVNFAHKFVSTYLTDCQNFAARGGVFNAAPYVATLSPSYLEPPTPTDAVEAAAAAAAAEQPLEEETPPPPSSVLAVTAMRVLRLVLVTEHDCAAYVHQNCLNEVLEIFRLSWQRPAVAYECLRLFFCIVAYSSESSGLLGGSRANFVGVVSDQTCDSLSVGSVCTLRTNTKGGGGGGDSMMTGGGSVLGGGLRFTNVVRRAAGKLAGRMDDSTRGSPVLRANYIPGYGPEDLPRGRKPLGCRPWQKMKISLKTAETLIETTRKMLADPRNSKDFRLWRLGIGLLCFWACEKVGFDALYKSMPTLKSSHALILTLSPSSVSQASSVTDLPIDRTPSYAPSYASPRLKFASLFRNRGDASGGAAANFGTRRPQDDTAVLTLILQVFDNFNKDGLIMEAAEMLLAHMVLCITDESEANVVADRAFYPCARQLVLPNDEVPYLAQEVMSLYKMFLAKGWKGPCDSMREAYALLDYEFPLSLSGWSDDPYPEVLPTDRLELLTMDSGKPEKRAGLA